MALKPSTPWPQVSFPMWLWIVSVIEDKNEKRPMLTIKCKAWDKPDLIVYFVLNITQLIHFQHLFSTSFPSFLLFLISTLTPFLKFYVNILNNLNILNNPMWKTLNIKRCIRQSPLPIHLHPLFFIEDLI